MSSSNDADLRTPTRVRLTRNRAANDSSPVDHKAEAVKDGEESHDDFHNHEEDDDDEHADRSPSDKRTLHKPIGPGRVDSAITSAVRPIFEGIYELRDAE